jgi:phosphoribosylanthranilate isomerase
MGKKKSPERSSFFVKVCGMTDAENVSDITALAVSRIGFNFYPSSPRYVGRSPVIPVWESKGAKRIGIFVNMQIDGVVEIAERWSLDGLQLHGEESPNYCASLREIFSGEIIKVFGVEGEGVQDLIEPYHGLIDFVLFDTKCREFGGSGQSFDWNILNKYQGPTDFIVAGGLGADNVRDLLLALDSERFVGIDLNSKVEDSIGVKNQSQVRTILKVVEHELLRGRRGVLW